MSNMRIEIVVSSNEFRHVDDHMSFCGVRMCSVQWSNRNANTQNHCTALALAWCWLTWLTIVLNIIIIACVSAFCCCCTSWDASPTFAAGLLASHGIQCVHSLCCFSSFKLLCIRQFSHCGSCVCRTLYLSPALANKIRLKFFEFFLCVCCFSVACQFDCCRHNGTAHIIMHCSLCAVL